MVQGVWASKYNERAFLSMKKVGLNFLDLRMAVLVQRVVPAAYAFVIHTENPTNGAKDEIFAELVKGLGESIVSGMVPGSSLSFYAKKGSLDKPEVCCHHHACGSGLSSWQGEACWLHRQCKGAQYNSHACCAFVDSGITGNARLLICWAEKQQSLLRNRAKLKAALCTVCASRY